jgi:hypothetical protein
MESLMQFMNYGLLKSLAAVQRHLHAISADRSLGVVLVSFHDDAHHFEVPIDS